MDALLQTVDTLKTLGSDRYRVLLTIIPPAPRQTGQQAREALLAEGIPLFKQGIRRFAAYEKASIIWEIRISEVLKEVSEAHFSGADGVNVR